MDQLSLILSPVKSEKKTKGKVSIDPTKKIEKKTNRQVSFTKRRKGLFKKCEELCVDHGAQIGVITFSEGGKLFTFGNPNVDSVLQRYRDDCGSNNQVISGANEDVNNVGSGSNGFWWDEVEVDKLGLSELEEFKVKLEGLRDEVASRVEELNKGCSNGGQGQGVGPTIEDIDFCDNFDGIFDDLLAMEFDPDLELETKVI